MVCLFDGRLWVGGFTCGGIAAYRSAARGYLDLVVFSFVVWLF